MLAFLHIEKRAFGNTIPQILRNLLGPSHTEIVKWGKPNPIHEPSDYFYGADYRPLAIECYCPIFYVGERT